MSDLEPITRAENFWVNEGDLEPITRKEQYIKHLYDETQVVPEYPKTREEYFINKAGEELHDVTIEQLTATENRTYSEEGVAYSPVIVNVPQTTLTTLDVTENGTYTAPSGTAYNEVDVDVPLPENAYLLKDIPNTPSPIATFTDGAPLPMPKLEVAVEPQQDLHGYDSPWVGGSGRNLFSVGSRVDGTIADVRYTSDDEYIYLNGTKQGISYADLSSASNITLDSGTYYIRAFVISGTVSNTIELYPYDGTNNLTSNIINNERTLTLSESKTFRFRFAIWTDGTALTNYKVGIVVSKTSSIDKFYPYANECPIIGWSAVDVTVADDVDNPTTTETITIQLGDTYYGCKVDVVSGVLTVDSYGITITGTESFIYKNGTYPSIYGIFVDNMPGHPYFKGDSSTAIYRGINSMFDKKAYTPGDSMLDHTIDSYSGGFSNLGLIGNWVRFKESSFADYTIEQAKAKLAEFYANNKPLQIVFPIVEKTIQLTPTAVKSLLGTNNLWANTGDVVDGQYFSKEV